MTEQELRNDIAQDIQHRMDAMMYSAMGISTTSKPSHSDIPTADSIRSILVDMGKIEVPPKFQITEGAIENHKTDWSGCRSPSRAMRRARQGHRQNTKIIGDPCAYQIENTIYIHPVMARRAGLQT